MNAQGLYKWVVKFQPYASYLEPQEYNGAWTLYKALARAGCEPIGWGEFRSSLYMKCNEYTISVFIGNTRLFEQDPETKQLEGLGEVREWELVGDPSWVSVWLGRYASVDLYGDFYGRRKIELGAWRRERLLLRNIFIWVSSNGGYVELILYVDYNNKDSPLDGVLLRRLHVMYYGDYRKVLEADCRRGLFEFRFGDFCDEPRLSGLTWEERFINEKMPVFDDLVGRLYHLLTDAMPLT